MKTLLLAGFCFISFLCQGQVNYDTIQLHFLYGSVPAKGYKESEKKLFGGIKGGHVNIEANGKVLDFFARQLPDPPGKQKTYRWIQIKLSALLGHQLFKMDHNKDPNYTSSNEKT